MPSPPLLPHRLVALVFSSRFFLNLTLIVSDNLRFLIHFTFKSPHSLRSLLCLSFDPQLSPLSSLSSIHRVPFLRFLRAFSATLKFTSSELHLFPFCILFNSLSPSILIRLKLFKKQSSILSSCSATELPRLSCNETCVIEIMWHIPGIHTTSGLSPQGVQKNNFSFHRDGLQNENFQTNSVLELPCGTCWLCSLCEVL